MKKMEELNTISGSKGQGGKVMTTEALYTISKNAKNIRDNIQTLNIIRKKVKEYLFNNEDVNLTEEESEMLDKFGVKAIDFTLQTSGEFDFSDGYNSARDILSGYKSELGGFRNIYFSDAINYEETEGFMLRLEDVLDENTMDLLRDDDGMISVAYDTKEADIREVVKDEDIVKEIISVQEYTKSVISALNTIEDRQSRLHEFLSGVKSELDDLRERKQSLYDLKSAVLILSGIAPVAYHELDNGDLLAYYIWNGFKFHMPVDPLTIENDDPVRTDPDAHIGLISAENKLDNPPSLDEAIQALLDFLKIEDITPQEYLSKGCDLEDRLGIKIYRPNRYNKNSYVEEYYDDEYDCDDNYDYDDMY